MQWLTAPFGLTEIKEAIFKFKNGKSPGPDGISVEFYQATFEVIKFDLQRVLNGFLHRGKIPAKYKTGLITLKFLKRAGKQN